MSERTEQRRYHHGGLRAALLEAAERSLRERGTEQLSLRDLAREVGVSHAAPRRHFPERQDLLDALAESGFRRLGERIRHAVANGDADFASRLGHATAAFADFATENPALLQLMNATKHQPNKAEVRLSAERAFEPLVDLIREGQDSHILQAGPYEKIGIILYATINGLATLINSGLVDAEQLDELTEAAVQQFLKGTAP
ncbi:TetR/AcrR family transcriptional regulator [Arthrobacter sp. zg-Y877]|uniref:TetR/AcrR family transcriptional regulator n=1 Tax=Arthrobacter sp. zg-Y877 TaxID=3049074 RepID=UPI0025A37FC6|nr:TetR/AcrR family transcriptional regulator [Arthrobacter sp. zg-Y877]MDM7989919.1 TetR/AcrR family transcriptional regulator [Arthrobacter sp. zg-Y877]